MNESDRLRELLRSAMPSQQKQGAERGAEGRDNALLATLLPPCEATKRLGNSRSTESAPTPLSDRIGFVQSLQEVHVDAIRTETSNISQVKLAHPRLAAHGNLIASTSHCIAYVLGGKKVRFIAQDNAASGLSDVHDASRLPIVDIAWSLQCSPNEAGTGLTSPSSQQYVASLSAGGEVCIGQVYAESNSTLAYAALCATTFPELQPARGLAWDGSGSNPLLAVFGAGPEVFLLTVLPSVHFAALTTELATIEAVKFSHGGGRLVIAGLDRIVIFDVKSIEETFTARTIPLPTPTERVWLLNQRDSDDGILAVAAVSKHSLLILPLFDERASEVIIDVSLPGASEDLFACYDQVSRVLCLGAYSSRRLLCVNLAEPASPVVAVGEWPNDVGAISVFETSQIRRHYAAADLFLYAFHIDSVKLHRITVNWSRTTSATEPERLPSPSRQILRPVRSASSAPDSHARSLGPSHPSPAVASPIVSDPSGTVKEIVASLSKQISEQGKQQRRERRDMEITEQRRQQELLASTVQGIQQAVVANLHTIVQQEMSRILDHKLASGIERMTEGLVQKVEPKCTSILEQRLGNQERFAQLVADRIRSSLNAQVADVAKDCFERVLLPGLQSGISEMGRQLCTVLSSAIVDASLVQHKQLLSDVAELRHSIGNLQKRADELPTALELTQSVTQALSPVVAPVQSVGADAAEDPAARLHLEIEGMISKGQEPAALIRVLELGDIEVLDWILPRLDAASVLESPQMATAVMLSLAQQLACELTSHTETKLAWLAEVFTVFNPRLSGSEDQNFADTIAGVLDEVFANLRVLLAQTPAPELQKQVKTVMRLIRMAM